jgi:hypothetical protein
MTESTSVTRENLITLLRIALPEFQIEPEWAEEQLGYPIINNLARHICDHAGRADFDEVRRGLAFLEVSLQHGDPYIRDLVLEGLETMASHREIESVKQYFGPRVRDLWDSFSQRHH